MRIRCATEADVGRWLQDPFAPDPDQVWSELLGRALILAHVPEAEVENALTHETIHEWLRRNASPAISRAFDALTTPLQIDSKKTIRCKVKLMRWL